MPSISLPPITGRQALQGVANSYHFVGQWGLHQKRGPPRDSRSAFQNQLHKLAEVGELSKGVNWRTYILQIWRLEAIWTTGQAIGEVTDCLYNILSCHLDGMGQKILLGRWDSWIGVEKGLPVLESGKRGFIWWSRSLYWTSNSDCSLKISLL